MISLLLASVLLQDPGVAPAAPDAPVGAAIVQLDVGTELVGRILRETSDYVEIELGPGNVVGVDKSRVRAVVRSAARTGEDGRPRAVDGHHDADAASSLAPYEARPSADVDRWFLLHDGNGKPVGWLHDVEARGDGGGVRLSQEWQFATADGTTELTVLEIVDSDGRPASSFYHERTRVRGDERVRTERVVRGVVEGATLVVDTRNGAASTRREYPFADDARFPLELRRELRTIGPLGPASADLEFVVFDPTIAELEHRRYGVGRARRVEHDGDVLTVRVLAAHSRGRSNVEWLDGTARPVRTELNGPSLVAVPSSERVARRARNLELDYGAAFRADASGRLGMWLPNPTWRFVDRDESGRITATAPLYGASVSAVHVSQVDDDATLDAAADAVARWVALLQPTLRVRVRAHTSVRGVDAVQLDGTYEVDPAQSERPERRFAMTLWVFRIDGATWAVCCHAPQLGFGDLQDDFRRIVAALELHPRGFAPELRGPLAERARDGRDARVRTNRGRATIR